MTILSLLLAGTIAEPMRRLAEGAQRVRRGVRAREEIPDLTDRHDEIGLLSGSLRDMTSALYNRIEAIERFAADVAHELKNPLASLSSAVEGLRSVRKPELKEQLHDVIADDVHRLDRLITDISDLSRVDARIARTRFTTVDVGTLIEGLLASFVDRQYAKPIPIAFARPQTGSAIVRGDAAQLLRVFENLLDNAISFSPDGGRVRISATRTQEQVVVKIDDDGPGVPVGSRDSIFDRFHSDRPEAEFGQHSGLGLAIARTILDAHDGSIRVTDREKGTKGACFIVTLPPAILPV